ncbi:ribonuclease HI [Candidatus Synchoanobacter obligatus]|uniref:Ribonuclease H n=1 Tax=Candidatus Synchoanobacter obligatus TaxID=2919597 RepID=A0ABT1L760_9GAMM|nr:ribonuclease HI [Candidatus Synchoanobacter obligatus]MCP8352470.1 ribonuclease HI [Candidatus Synchoanobacter obligatus]
MSQKVRLYTDGSCLGNPGRGGWAALLVLGEHEKLLSGAAYDTTNNRMELLAAVKGLAALKRHTKVEVWTDSQYVRRGMIEWLPGWVRNNWRNSQKKPVKNQDLWQMLVAEADKHEIEWHWVKGHSGHVENERVDEAARLAAEKLSE